jgi:hypothetical protein
MPNQIMVIAPYWLERVRCQKLWTPTVRIEIYGDGCPGYPRTLLSDKLMRMQFDRIASEAEIYSHAIYSGSDCGINGELSES